MNITITPSKLTGSLTAIPSKSQAHRVLICAAFSDAPTEIICPDTNQDIEATAQCLRALGAQIRRKEYGYSVVPTNNIPQTAILDCRESGSTLRFMLPIVGALGVDGTFQLAGRLPERPLSPLWEEMERMGCQLSRPDKTSVRCYGKLKSGRYEISGSISSQFITGLLFACALIPGNCSVNIIGKTESAPYIEMTQKVLATFGVITDDFIIENHYPFHSPGTLTVEGDWSNGSFFLAANSLGSQVQIEGLNYDSAQGDKVGENHLNKLDAFQVIDAADIPDLVPILAVVAGAKSGAEFKNIGRLRLKESDRVATVATMLKALGAKTEITENTMTVYPGNYHTCTIDSAGDHRIAMSAAIAATVADGPITVIGAECVSKSYPKFWTEYKRLGGIFE